MSFIVTIYSIWYLTYQYLEIIWGSCSWCDESNTIL